MELGTKKCSNANHEEYIRTNKRAAWERMNECFLDLGEKALWKDDLRRQCVSLGFLTIWFCYIHPWTAMLYPKRKTADETVKAINFYLCSFYFGITKLGGGI